MATSSRLAATTAHDHTDERTSTRNYILHVTARDARIPNNVTRANRPYESVTSLARPSALRNSPDASSRAPRSGDASATTMGTSSQRPGRVLRGARVLLRTMCADAAYHESGRWIATERTRFRGEEWPQSCTECGPVKGALPATHRNGYRRRGRGELLGSRSRAHHILGEHQLEHQHEHCSSL